MTHDEPEVILLDLSLPDAKGLETVRAMQAAAPELKWTGFKYYYTRPTGKTFYVHLMNTETAKLEAIIESALPCERRKPLTKKNFTVHSTSGCWCLP